MRGANSLKWLHIPDSSAVFQQTELQFWPGGRVVSPGSAEPRFCSASLPAESAVSPAALQPSDANKHKSTGGNMKLLYLFGLLISLESLELNHSLNV